MALFMFFHNIILNIYSEKATEQSDMCESVKIHNKYFFFQSLKNCKFIKIISGYTVLFSYPQLYAIPYSHSFHIMMKLHKKLFFFFLLPLQTVFVFNLLKLSSSPPLITFLLILLPSLTLYALFFYIALYSIEEASSPHGYIMMMLIRKVALFLL